MVQRIIFVRARARPAKTHPIYQRLQFPPASYILAFPSDARKISITLHASIHICDSTAPEERQSRVRVSRTKHKHAHVCKYSPPPKKESDFIFQSHVRANTTGNNRYFNSQPSYRTRPTDRQLPPQRWHIEMSTHTHHPPNLPPTPNNNPTSRISTLLQYARREFHYAPIAQDPRSAPPHQPI